MKEGEFTAVELVMKHDKPYLRFFGRWSDKTKMDFTLAGHKPFFYVPSEEMSKIDFPCKLTGGFKSFLGEDVLKVEVENPFDIQNTKKQQGLINKFARTFESDLSYPTQFLIMHDLYSGIKYDQTITPTNCEVEPRLAIIDIETEYYGGANKEMSCPINAVTIHDNYTNKLYTIAYSSTKETGVFDKTIIDHKLMINVESHTELVTDEIALLKALKKLILDFDFDIFTGWNVTFDMIYILSRLEYHNLNPKDLSPTGKYYYSKDAHEKRVMIRGRAIIDMLKGYRRIKWKQVGSFRLDAIAETEFDSNKIHYTGWIGEFWKKNFDTFLDYNRKDVEICMAINQKYSIMESLLGVRRMSGCELSDILANSRVIDVYILRHCRNKFVLPAKQKDYGKANKITGGFVLDPVVGLHKNVCVLDLKSLYPSIMLSFNMSPETISDNGEIMVGNGIRFKKEIGLLTQILTELIAKRDEVRAMLKRPEIVADTYAYTKLYKKQYYFKTFTNSFYGVNSFQGFRLYNPNIGGSITYVGRLMNKQIREFCEKKGWRVIYADTDSVFLNRDDITDKQVMIDHGKQIEKEINSMFKEWFVDNHNDTSYMSIKFEKLYDVLYKGAEKKMYAGRIGWDWEAGNTSKLEIKGFATVKTDRSQLTKAVQKHILEMILDFATKDQIIEYLIQQINDFLDKKYSWAYIGIPKAITQDVDTYAVKNPWVRGVKYSMTNVYGFTFSPKPYLIYTIPTETANTDVICFNEEIELQNLKFTLDTEKMLMASIYRVVEHLLPAVNIDPVIIQSYIQNRARHQKTLFDF